MFPDVSRAVGLPPRMPLMLPSEPSVCDEARERARLCDEGVNSLISISPPLIAAGDTGLLAAASAGAVAVVEAGAPSDDVDFETGAQEKALVAEAQVDFTPLAKLSISYKRCVERGD